MSSPDIQFRFEQARTSERLAAPGQQEILDALRIEVPAELDRQNPHALKRAVRQGSCVQATRVGIEALNYFGVEAKPLVTLLMTGNAAWVEWMGQDVPPLPMPEEVWSVGIDPGFTGKGYSAHLVIQYDGGLLDLDAGFSARPERGIHIPPTVFIPLLDPKPDTGVIAAMSLDEGGLLLYREWQPKENYREIGAWRNSRKWAGPVIRAMKERLA